MLNSKRNTYVLTQTGLSYTKLGTLCLSIIEQNENTLFFFIKDVRGWQFLTTEAAETLCIICLPPKEHIFRKNTWVTDLSKSHIL